MAEDGARAPSVEEREKWRAEAQAAIAEAQKLLAEAAKAQAEAAIAQIAQRRAEREERELLAANRFHHLHYFTDSVSESSVKRCMDELTIWHRLEPGCQIEVVFTSPGGDVVSGIALFDFLHGLRHDGHRVVTGTYGMAASMAGILLQAGEHRWMAREAWVLLHEGSFGAVGTVAQVEDRVQWVKRIEKRILNIFAERAAAKTGKSVGAMRRYFQSHWRRKDWWLDSDECLALGLVDEVR